VIRSAVAGTPASLLDRRSMPASTQPSTPASRPA
jgi:hypothetical protein